jgi:hypothetical protein
VKESVIDTSCTLYSTHAAKRSSVLHADPECAGLAPHPTALQRRLSGWVVMGANRSRVHAIAAGARQVFPHPVGVSAARSG